MTKITRAMVAAIIEWSPEYLQCLLWPDFFNTIGHQRTCHHRLPMSVLSSETGHQRADLRLTNLRNNYSFQDLDPSVEGIGEPLQDTGGPSKLDQAKEAVQAATETVKETTQSVAKA